MVARETGIGYGLANDKPVAATVAIVENRIAELCLDTQT